MQHVNALDSRLKKWIGYRFGGVSSNDIQKYLNWFKTKERQKNSKEFLKDFANRSLEDIKALERYRQINLNYEELMKITTHN